MVEDKYNPGKIKEVRHLYPKWLVLLDSETLSEIAVVPLETEEHKSKFKFEKYDYYALNLIYDS